MEGGREVKRSGSREVRKPEAGSEQAEGRPAKGVGRRERRRADTRERLFRAALGLFAEQGFQGTTVEQITEAADVGKGTFFNYFPSKEHVLAAFGEMQVGKFQALLASHEANEPAGALLRRAVGELSAEPGRSAALVRSLLGAQLTSEEVRKLILEKLGIGRELLVGVFQQAQEWGEVRQELHAEALAAAFQQMLFGGLFLWSLAPEEKLADRQGRTFELFWSGIAVKQEREP